MVTSARPFHAAAAPGKRRCLKGGAPCRRAVGRASVIWLLGTVFLSLGLVNLDFSRGWWRGQLRRLAVGVPAAGVYCYVALPPLVFPQAFSLLLLPPVPHVP